MRRIRDIANAACSEALVGGHFRGESINWGDLSCAEALICLDDDNHVSYLVRLEEAAPNSTGLCSFVAQRLRAAGYGDVEVEASW